MYRVAFALNASDLWLGGLNYFKNLIAAIQSVPGRVIDPVVITPSDSEHGTAGIFPNCTVISSPLVGGGRMYPAAVRRVRNIVGRDFLLESTLRRHQIRLLSHSEFLGRNASIPAIGWIPDFQHKFLPSFFSPTEIAKRDAMFARLAKHCQAVILSSEDAKNHFCRFFPQHMEKAKVLHFVSRTSSPESPPSMAEIEEQYGVRAPYIYLPNQFWRHKNHQIVLDAIELLCRNGTPALVVSTGQTNDNRAQDYFSELQKQIAAKGLSQWFRILGLVPYHHAVGLMRGATAMLNPSLFEGWSSSVEEAKTLGKPVILSDIAVHKEQAPRLATFFDPADAQTLANAILKSIRGADQDLDTLHQVEAQAAFARRFEDFGRRYQDIALSLIEKK